MTHRNIIDVEFGYELEPFTPDTALTNTTAFADAVGYSGNGRFEDH